MAVSRVYCGGKEYKVTGVGYEPQGEFFIGDRAIIPEQESAELIETLKAGYMCNNATLAENRDGEGYNIVGDPTEGALLVSAIKAGITLPLTRLDEIPFTPEQQYMATLYAGANGNGNRNVNIIYLNLFTTNTMTKERDTIQDFYELSVNEIMDKRLPLIEKDANLDQVFSILTVNNHIWIVESKESKKLVGIIT